MSIEKPPHGSPCNSCGWCCRMTRCPLAQWVFKLPEVGTCPALQMIDEKSTCGLVADPGQYQMALTLQNGVAKMREAALRLIGSGVGCDAIGDDEEPNREYEAGALATAQRLGRAKVKAALKLWGVGTEAIR